MRRRPLLQPDEKVLKRIFAVLFVLSLLPAVLISIPAMVDYPNHLARMFLLNKEGGNPFYEVRWALYPNLAMDLIVPALSRFTGVETATRLFCLLSQILVVTGAIAIELAVKRRFHIAGIVAVLFLYCLPFAWGFVNFEFGLGVALWGIACAVYLEKRSWFQILIAHTVFVCALFVAHFFALGIYGFTLGVWELWRISSKRVTVSEVARRLIALALPAIAVIGMMLFYAGAVGGSGTAWYFQYKPLWLLHILNGYSLALSVMGVLVLAAITFLLSKHGALKFHSAGGWLAVGFGALYLLMPSKLFDTSFVDLRVIAAAAFILPAFVSVSFPNKRWEHWVAFSVIAVAVANIALVAFVWNSYRDDYNAMIDSFTKIKKGSLVLVGHSGEADDPPLKNLFEYPIYHAPVLAVGYADAFVPTLFTASGKQPVSVRPPYRHLALPYGGPAPISILKAIYENRTPPETPLYVRSWVRDFDYLYVVGPRTGNVMPDLLEEIYGGPRFVLYRIRKETNPRR